MKQILTREEFLWSMVTSNERNGVWINGKLTGCFFSNLSRLIPNKVKDPHHWSFMKWAHRWIQLRKGQ